MIEKIKKLVESSNYEDNKLALILIYKMYGKKKLLEMRDEYDKIPLFGINTDSNPNGLYIGDFILFHSSGGNVCFQKVPPNFGSEGFINWGNETENKEIIE